MIRAVIRGGGDLGSGIALRLWRCGFEVVVLEAAAPVAVRRTVAFAEAVYEGAQRVEEARGVLAAEDDVESLIAAGDIPVLVDPATVSLSALHPAVLIDATMAKRNLGTRSDMAPITVAVGPGFHAPEDAHAVVETQRGPHLGRVVWEGGAERNTGVPGAVAGRGVERVLRAPAQGVFSVQREIGDIVAAGDVVARVAGEPIEAPFPGLVRGLLRPDTLVSAGMKVGDLDPRLDPSLAFLVSDKALAVAGGVLEAILSLSGGRRRDDATRRPSGRELQAEQ
ncbi:MAG TPA: selenium-dependent molybdenum cofactor biosynthesis protein YqeB [Chloroflexota bacterium]|nr:selenium-dependent molybdenum cofactor biosynthesis protein YqeB [Chloroflexota bacterium]